MKKSPKSLILGWKLFPFVTVESNVIVCQICNVTSQTQNLIDNRFHSKFVEDDCNHGMDDDGKDTEEDKKCTSCHDNASATSWCVECEEFICENCVLVSVSMPNSSRLTLTELIDSERMTGSD